jgi:hypothetical protein
MDEPCYYEIRIAGRLTDQWSDWLEGLIIQSAPEGHTTLSGLLADQSALLGVLIKIHALNLTLISISRQQDSKGLQDL